MFKVKVAALVDTGSSINIMSSELFRSLPSYCQLSFRPHVVSKITLANNQQIAIEGTAIVKIKIPHSSQKQSILVYILKQTSHPFILGIDYLRSHGIIIDFSKDDIFTTKGDVVKVRCRNDITILPNTECIIFGKIPKRCVLGSQGVVSAHKFLLQKCFSCKIINYCKSGTCGSDQTVESNSGICVHKEKFSNSYITIS